IQHPERGAGRRSRLDGLSVHRGRGDDFRGFPGAHVQAEPGCARATRTARRRVPLEIERHGNRGRRDPRPGLLAARPALRTGAPDNPNHRRCLMNDLPSVTGIVAEVQERFGDRLDAVRVCRRDEIYFDAKMDLVAGFSGHLYKKWDARLVSVFADDVREQENVFHLYYVYALDAVHAFFILRVPVPPDKSEFTSLTNAIPAANWQEREIQDLFGLKLIGHPNPGRCALHDDWPDVHPLRKDFDLHTQLPPFQGERHKFRQVEGEGVFQVPVGPVHAGIIEPGHFLFSVAGEPVLYLQLRMFYVHKGIEKLFETLPVAHGVRLAESISGDSSFAHATAFCHALERAAGKEPPPRARALRTLCLELERLYNHVSDIGAICTDVAFVTANMHAMRLKESVLRLNEELTGNRLLRGMACPGGVRFDFDAGQLRAMGRSEEHTSELQS